MHKRNEEMACGGDGKSCTCEEHVIHEKGNSESGFFFAFTMQEECYELDIKMRCKETGKEITWHRSKAKSWRETYLFKVVFILVVVILVKFLNILIVV